MPLEEKVSWRSEVGKFRNQQYKMANQTQNEERRRIGDITDQDMIESFSNNIDPSFSNPIVNDEKSSNTNIWDYFFGVSQSSAVGRNTDGMGEMETENSLNCNHRNSQTQNLEDTPNTSNTVNNDIWDNVLDMFESSAVVKNTNDMGEMETESSLNSNHQNSQEQNLENTLNNSNTINNDIWDNVLGMSQSLAAVKNTDDMRSLNTNYQNSQAQNLEDEPNTSSTINNDIRDNVLGVSQSSAVVKNTNDMGETDKENSLNSNHQSFRAENLENTQNNSNTIKDIIWNFLLEKSQSLDVAKNTDNMRETKTENSLNSNHQNSLAQYLESKPNSSNIISNNELDEILSMCQSLHDGGTQNGNDLNTNPTNSLAQNQANNSTSSNTIKNSINNNVLGMSQSSATVKNSNAMRGTKKGNSLKTNHQNSQKENQENKLTQEEAKRSIWSALEDRFIYGDKCELQFNNVITNERNASGFVSAGIDQFSETTKSHNANEIEMVKDNNVLKTNQQNIEENHENRNVIPNQKSKLNNKKVLKIIRKNIKKNHENRNAIPNQNSELSYRSTLKNKILFNSKTEIDFEDHIPAYYISKQNPKEVFLVVGVVREKQIRIRNKKLKHDSKSHNVKRKLEDVPEEKEKKKRRKTKDKK